MAEQTVYVYATSGVTITRALGGGAPFQGNVIGNALNGNAFSWENPSDLNLTFSGAMTAITFDDADGVLTDDPFSGATVTDQRLTQALSIDGVTYAPSAETTRWQNPPPVNVENEYEVTLYGPTGTPYRMVGVSITRGYVTTVVGVTFDGDAPPPGTVLTYIQGVSSYSGTGQTLTIPDETICFLAGTHIDTPDGPRPIESLSAGMLVNTLAKGPQPIRWIGRSAVCGLGKLAPICVKAGVLGNHRDLYLSPNHRVLLHSPMAELSFGQAEVLVMAKALVDDVSVRRCPMPRADYLHLMLDNHEVVFSEGVPAETLFTGSVTMDVMSPEALAELYAIFPDLDTARTQCSHMVLTTAETRYLMRSQSFADVHAAGRCAA